jgi:hypothetical protein
MRTNAAKILDGSLTKAMKHLQYYLLDIPEFFQEYEFGRGNVMHVRNMVYKLLTNEDIDETIEKILA